MFADCTLTTAADTRHPTCRPLHPRDNNKDFRLAHEQNCSYIVSESQQGEGKRASDRLKIERPMLEGSQWKFFETAHLSTEHELRAEVAMNTTNATVMPMVIEDVQQVMHGTGLDDPKIIGSQDTCVMSRQCSLTLTSRINANV